MQMQLGKISTALVGGHDEMTEWHFGLLRKTGYMGIKGMSPSAEVAMSMMMSTDPQQNHLCELAGIAISHKPSPDMLSAQVEKLLQEAGMTMDDLDAVMIGVNGNEANDRQYAATVPTLFAGKPLLRYKHLFGENHTASALGVYAAAHCLAKGTIPACIYDEKSPGGCETPRSILVVNMVEGRNSSLILLKKI